MIIITPIMLTVDVSKKHKEFRNLEYNFMIDNGYLLFDVINETPGESMIGMILESITNNLMSKTKNITKIIPHWDLINSSHYSRTVIVGIATNDIVKSFRPGQHYVVNHFLCDNNENVKKMINEIETYELKMKKGQFAFFHPFQLYEQFDWTEKGAQNIDWYIVESDDVLEIETMWGSWDILKKNIEFTPLDEFNKLTFSQFFKLNENTNKIWEDINHIQCTGIGELIKLTASQFVFRIRPISTDKDESKIFIKLGPPSIYESMIEIVYFLDQEHNTDENRFEVRTIGVLSKACNVIFSCELSQICSKHCSFDFDVEKIYKHLININYNEKILEWYPRTVKKIVDDTDNNLHLKFKKRYDIYVYKFEFMDAKFMPRINMILSWIKELELKGGFILSDPSNKQHGYPRSMGYMILGGDDTNNSDSYKSDLCVFQERFKCLHWKKVKHYYYSNHDYISQIDYNELPDNHFCYTTQDVKSLNDNGVNILYKILVNM